MARRQPLTATEKKHIYFGKLSGQRLADLADEVNCSLACARKWWRIGRDGGVTALLQKRPADRKTGALSRFAPIVAQQALVWKRKYPRRGADRILVEMGADPLLRNVPLPKASTLAGFFKVACPELLQKRQPRPQPPPKASRVHEVWQMDAKEKIVLGDGTIVTVLQVREPALLEQRGLTPSADPGKLKKWIFIEPEKRDKIGCQETKLGGDNGIRTQNTTGHPGGRSARYRNHR